MTRRRIWWAIPLLVIAVSLFAVPALAQGQTTVTGAGGGVYPAGTTIKGGSISALKGVTLTGLTFGMGVALPGDSTANGNFESTLVGTSAKGLPRNIVVEGNVTSGSGQAGGSANYTGICTVNPGDGTATLTGVPFTVNVAKLPNGAWGITLTLSSTSLPAATVTSGSVTIK
jgi:hypothetical protein